MRRVNNVKDLRMRLIKELFRNNKINLMWTLVAALFSSAACMVMSWAFKEVCDLIAGVSKYSFGQLLLITLSYLGLDLISYVIMYIFLGRFRSQAMQQYRDLAFSLLLRKRIHAFSRENSARYISALSNDAITVERDLLLPVQRAIELVVSFIGALIMMLWFSPLLTLVAICFMLLPTLVTVILGDKASLAEKKVSDARETYIATIKDVLSGFAVIKSFNAEKSISKVHDADNLLVKTACQRRTRVNVLVSGLSSVSGSSVQTGVFVTAAALAVTGNTITPGVAIAFVQLLNYLIQPMQFLPGYYASIKSSFALVDKLAEGLNRNVTDEGKIVESRLREGIVLEEVSFEYEPGKPVLQDLNLEFDAGGCYALVGVSGSGKTTILNLLMAASYNYEGQISYDGQEVKSITASSLYNLVSIIQQGVFIFDATIKDNVTMFADFPAADVEQALQRSGLNELIQAKGAEYKCGENGSGLSGGERQRISIARALLRKTPVLLVDEATAALDNETSFEIFNSILDLEGYTRIIVTHDLNARILERCTKIFTLRHGQMIESGTFQELMDQKHYFYSLFNVTVNA